jgi:hypothetical protein
MTMTKEDIEKLVSAAKLIDKAASTFEKTITEGFLKSHDFLEHAQHNALTVVNHSREVAKDFLSRLSGLVESFHEAADKNAGAAKDMIEAAESMKTAANRMMER